jgi:hypothetical protein
VPSSNYLLRNLELESLITSRGFQNLVSPYLRLPFVIDLGYFPRSRNAAVLNFELIDLLSCYYFVLDLSQGYTRCVNHCPMKLLVMHFRHLTLLDRPLTCFARLLDVVSDGMRDANLSLTLTTSAQH